MQVPRITVTTNYTRQLRAYSLRARAADGNKDSRSEEKRRRASELEPTAYRRRYPPFVLTRARRRRDEVLYGRSPFGNAQWAIVICPARCAHYARAQARFYFIIAARARFMSQQCAAAAACFYFSSLLFLPARTWELRV